MRNGLIFGTIALVINLINIILISPKFLFDRQAVHTLFGVLIIVAFFAIAFIAIDRVFSVRYQIGDKLNLIVASIAVCLTFSLQRSGVITENYSVVLYVIIILTAIIHSFLIERLNPMVRG